MTKRNNGRIPLCLLAAFFCIFLTTKVAASNADWAAKIISIQGSVEAQKTRGHPWQQVEIDDTFVTGATVRVKTNSRATVLLANQAIIRLAQNTAITFPPSKKKKFSLLKLLSGAAHFFSHIPRSLEVQTPFVNASVEGTEFFIRVENEHTLLSVFRGSVAAVNQAGSLVLSDGQSAIASRESPPEIKFIVRPRDAVQWAMNYPLIFDFSSFSFSLKSAADRHDQVKKSLLDFQHGRMVEALSRLVNLTENIVDPTFFSYRAMLHLSSGQQQQAAADITTSLKLNPDFSDAYALKSIIAVINNDKENALSYGQKAINSDPESPAARLALSYALQADFQLEQALKNVNKAVELTPENALALARQAELELANGALRQAVNSAKQAVHLKPQLARPHSVLGFASLTTLNVDQAIVSFQEAIKLDPADHMARLGIGLAKIKQGKLAEGKRDIEIAASLAPGNSLIRSYLGKAFFEEKNNKLAMRQLDVAKELDPNDPTPWLYSAISKQNINQPIEALHDIQKSIELNNNRAIYRSQFLLDEDLAVRNVSLADIFNDIGFQQLAMVAGWASLDKDPANYSAHRFLADSYSALPRHGIARASELLQAQLLQPGNVLPTHTQLAEYNSFIPSSLGPSEPGFNEHTALFNRDRFALKAHAITGGNATFGDEIFQSGLIGKFSYSIGQYHYESDGFRDNNEQKKDIVNFFSQLNLSHKTTVQLELKHTENEHGDLELRFDPDNFYPGKNFENEITSARIGFHHAFSPGSDLIGFANYWQSDSLEEYPEFIFDLLVDDDDDKRFQTELRYIKRFDKNRVTFGMGRTDEAAHETAYLGCWVWVTGQGCEYRLE